MISKLIKLMEDRDPNMESICKMVYKKDIEEYLKSASFQALKMKPNVDMLY